ncbi:hypothetical protein EI200_11235 [Peribacillus simplex]|nr:hypothetical protein EI200_11235 [Peribacillus simplex]
MLQPVIFLRKQLYITIRKESRNILLQTGIVTLAAHGRVSKAGNLGSEKTRSGTYDIDLKRIGD